MSSSWKKRFVRLWIAASIFWVSIVWVVAVPQVYKSLPEQLTQQRIQTSVEFAAKYYAGEMSSDFQDYYQKLKQRGNILDIQPSPQDKMRYLVMLADGTQIASYTAQEPMPEVVERLAGKLEQQWNQQFRQLTRLVALFVIAPPVLLWVGGYALFWLILRPTRAR